MKLSTFGGLKRERHKATGFFHAEKSGKRWRLVDPEGHPFIHVGVVAVSPPGGNKTPPDWAEATSNLLHDHGFNGTGAWSENEGIRVGKRPVVYTKIWNLMSSYGSKRGGMYQQSGHMGYPGDCIFVFDPQFPVFCDEYAKRLASTKDDPWLLGHFSDNECRSITRASTTS